nr:MAG TPA: hypothetical protein [Bacteriophage sp.]DAO84992.1 MAG TPA: hypothetical protein [Caudoviricetes sp.]
MPFLNIFPRRLLHDRFVFYYKANPYHYYMQITKFFKLLIITLFTIPKR